MATGLYYFRLGSNQSCSHRVTTKLPNFPESENHYGGKLSNYDHFLKKLDSWHLTLSFKKNEVSGNENSIFGFLHRPLILNNWSMSPLSVYCFGRLNSSNLERSREREMQPICVPSRLPFAGPGSRARVGPLHSQCWVNHQQVSR